MPENTDNHRQPMVNFNRPLAEQFPEPGEDVVRAAYWISGIVAVVSFGLHLAKVL